MSGLYNVVLGDGNEGGRGAIASVVLGLRPEDIPRFRDCFFEKSDIHGAVIAIYTRVGGNNRPDYQEQIDRLRANPFYLSDDDDEFDSTYAMFRFLLPPLEHPVTMPSMWQFDWPYLRNQIVENTVEPVDMDKRWLDAIGSV